MTSKKVFFGMSGLVVLLSGLAIVTIIVGDISLKNKSKALLDAKLENTSLEQQQAALIKAKKDIEQYKELEQISKTIVPQDKDQAKAVREIINIAKKSNIVIRSITFPASTLGNKATPAAPPPSGSSSGTSEESTPATPAVPPLTQAKPVEGISGVYSLEMNIVPETSEAKAVNYYQFLDFLTRLENNRRTAQVTRIKISPISSKQNIPYVDFTLTINIFVKP